LPAVLRRPVVADRKSELVRLACRFTIESAVAHLPRSASLHLGLHAGVREDQSAAIEHVVAHELVQEIRSTIAKPLIFSLELRERIGKTVRNLYVSTAE